MWFVGAIAYFRETGSTYDMEDYIIKEWKCRVANLNP